MENGANFSSRAFGVIQKGNEFVGGAALNAFGDVVGDG